MCFVAVAHCSAILSGMRSIDEYLSKYSNIIIVPIFHILYKDPWKSAVTVKCGNGQLSCFVPLDSSQDTVTSGVQTVIIFLMAQAKESIK